MSESRAAIRYAKAVLSLASDDKKEDAVAKDMKNLSSLIEHNLDLYDMLQSPVISSSDKKSILVQVLGDVNAITLNLVDLLITNKRLNLLGAISATYMRLYDVLRDKQLAKVITAVPITQDLQSKVLLKIKELTGKSTEIENTVDASILGGFILRVGDLQYDASIINKLNKIKREFTLN